MGKSNPALVTQTKLENNSSTDVKVATKRVVTYILKISSAKNFSLPYAVSVGGIIPNDFKVKPKRVSGDGGKIIVKDVEPGQEVKLFLNSDAHPAYRANPVYLVTPQARDVVVNILEKRGKHPDADEVVKCDENNSQNKIDDTYFAVLTGDIWMKVSHKYLSSEVDGIIQSPVDPVILSSVKKIYDGLAQNLLQIDFHSRAPANGSKKLLVVFDDGDNARNNIKSGYDFLREGLSRVHPAAYAAVFSAARDSDVEKIEINSGWRPMLGSIAHRAGLGLDINVIGSAKLIVKNCEKRMQLELLMLVPTKKLFFLFLKNLKPSNPLLGEMLILPKLK